MKSFFTRRTLIFLILLSVNTAYADKTIEYLKEFCNAYGVSGFEGEVRKILSGYLAEQKMQYEIDGIGITYICAFKNIK